MARELTQQTLKENLSYSSETGLFVWRPVPKSAKNSHRAWAIYMGKLAGKIAGSPDSKGYIQIMLDGKNYKAHRLAWLYVHGEMPEHIDHSNHVVSDNRISNLSSVGHPENMKNQLMKSSNTSGVCGVSWNKAGTVWEAYITCDGKRKHLGRFASLLDAASARLSAQIRMGFHENHGKPTTG